MWKALDTQRGKLCAMTRPIESLVLALCIFRRGHFGLLKIQEQKPEKPKSYSGTIFTRQVMAEGIVLSGFQHLRWQEPKHGKWGQ